MKFRAVILPDTPALLQRLRDLVFIVHLADGDAAVSQIQHLVVQIGVGIALITHDFLNPVIAPAWPVVRGHHHVSILAEPVQGLIDLA